MKIALLQFDTLWENKEANLQHIVSEIQQLPDDVDLVILPEMFTTGFTMNPYLVAEEENENTLAFIQNLAQKNDVAIVGSWVIKENEMFYNRLFFVYPNSDYKTYNKRHLFTLAGEEKVYQPGKDKLIVEYKGWKICPLVCYDLRFPVYSRIVAENYDLLIYVASWPDRRIHAWNSLLKARAIENMSYVVGVNRSGIDPNGLEYSGHSQVIDYMGEYVVAPIFDETIQLVSIDKFALQKVRSKFAFLDDADAFELLKIKSDK